jgi:hypothetical protein
MGYYRKGYFGDGHLSVDGAALAEFIPKAFGALFRNISMIELL